jgi:hypothetical protein
MTTLSSMEVKSVQLGKTIICAASLFVSPLKSPLDDNVCQSDGEYHISGRNVEGTCKRGEGIDRYPRLVSRQRTPRPCFTSRQSTVLDRSVACFSRAKSLVTTLPCARLLPSLPPPDAGASLVSLLL